MKEVLLALGEVLVSVAGDRTLVESTSESGADEGKFNADIIMACDPIADGAETRHGATNWYCK
jgi:hypothetical protein